MKGRLEGKMGGGPTVFVFFGRNEINDKMTSGLYTGHVFLDWFSFNERFPFGFPKVTRLDIFPNVPKPLPLDRTIFINATGNLFSAERRKGMSKKNSPPLLAKFPDIK